MEFSEKFQNKMCCICNAVVLFETIDDVKCDWGTHTLIQCPVCEELFSIDVQCPAFQDVSKLFANNPELYSKEEKFHYTSNAHPA